MQLSSVAPTTASSLSKQRKKFKVLGEHDANGNSQRLDKVKLARFLGSPRVAAVVALSPISNPPVSVGETVDVHGMPRRRRKHNTAWGDSLLERSSKVNKQPQHALVASL